MPKELIDYIAQIISEDPNEPAQAQAQAQLNKRQITMIKMVNEVERANVPLTAEGYNQLGRSDGILKILSGNMSWAKLSESKIGAKIFQGIPADDRVTLLANFLRTIGK